MNEELKEKIEKVNFFYSNIAEVVLDKVNNFIDIFPMAEGTRDELLITAAISEMCDLLDSISDEDDESCCEQEPEKSEENVAEALRKILGV